MARRSGSTTRAILLAGLAAGAVDLVAAFVIYRSAGPQRILQSIAAGLQGDAAFAGGLTSAAVGLAAHLLIAILFAALYVAAARAAPVLLRRPWLAGPAFGVVVYGWMNAIVVPLSRAPTGAPPPSEIIGQGLVAHLLFGLTLALIAARLLPRR